MNKAFDEDWIIKMFCQFKNYFDLYIFYIVYVSTNRGVHFKDNTIQSYGIGLSGEHTHGSLNPTICNCDSWMAK